MFRSNKEYGIIIHDLVINGKNAPYPVFNERILRAGTGIMFVIALIAYIHILYTSDYTILLWVTPLYLFDFICKVGWGMSIFAFFGQQLVHNQRPEWVGAIQKRFAWSIGLVISCINTIILFFAPNFIVSIVLPLCFICLVFMWLETSAGICVGCTIYYYLIDNGFMSKPNVEPACPGGVCDIRHHKHARHLRQDFVERD